MPCGAGKLRQRVTRRPWAAPCAGGNHGGSVGGRPGNSSADKFFNVCSALGSLGFAYSFAIVSAASGARGMRTAAPSAPHR
jgi:hypothetical protein